MKRQEIQLDYTAYGSGYQLKIPLETEILIPEDDPVRLLDAICERMDYEELYAAYSEEGRAGYSPRILFKVMVYANMRKIYSTRGIEQSCCENIKFMYLLEGQPAPDHNTIGRFRKHRLREAMAGLFRQLVELLEQAGEIDLGTVFIDGTKIEAQANRYTFVWKKSVEKRMSKLVGKMAEEWPKLRERNGLHKASPEKIQTHHVKKLLKQLKKLAKEQKLVFVYGKGKRKQPLQRDIETVSEWLRRLKEYQNSLHICGERGSYSKTDKDATFMHVKEDHMKNGQLKPCYNVNVATASEYVIGSYLSADCTDTNTLIPFLQQLPLNKIHRLVADAGYESEENYTFFEGLPHTDAYIKPANHEQKKKRKYRTDPGRRENMTYCAEKDEYTCVQGKCLKLTEVKTQKTKTGFRTETSIYRCEDCQGCPCKDKCIRKGTSKKPLAERTKSLYVNKNFLRQRDIMEQRISSDEGCLLRVNRSIQAEGTFAMTKEDMLFRRFLTRGKYNVTVEWLLLCFAYNVLKLDHKAKTDRLGTHLVVPKELAA